MTRRQRVVIHRVADRHADVHGREFGDTTECFPTPDSVRAALLALGFHPPMLPAAWSITIDWPYDGPDPA